MLLPWGEEVVYFVTICEKHRRPVWANRAFFDAFSLAVDRLESRRLWFVHAAVIMPDHLHLLATPMRCRKDTVGNLSGALKRWTRAALDNPEWEWQEGSFDRLLRTGESASRKWDYLRENPVRAGWVDDWRMWPWSLGLRELKSIHEGRDPVA